MQTSLFQYRFSHAGKTDIGLQRQENQDTVILCPEQGFFAVSDGMGGLAEGGRTSQMIAQVLPQMVAEIAKEAGQPPCPNPENAALSLNRVVRELSYNIYAKGNAGKHAAFGATVSGVWLVADKAIFVNLGDSRGYLLAKGAKALKRVTMDHNVAQLMVELGQLAEAETRFHKASSILTHFVGMPSPAESAVYTKNVQPGDRILLCSDGLHGMAGDDEIAPLLAGEGGAENLCDRLISLANANGGRDNIAVICVEIR